MTFQPPPAGAPERTQVQRWRRDVRAALGTGDLAPDLQRLADALDGAHGEDGLLVDLHSIDTLTPKEAGALAAWIGCGPIDPDATWGAGVTGHWHGRPVEVRLRSLAAAGLLRLDARVPVATVVVATAPLDLAGQTGIAMVRADVGDGPVYWLGGGFPRVADIAVLDTDLTRLPSGGLRDLLAGPGGGALDGAQLRSEAEQLRRIARAALHALGRVKARCEGELIRLKEESAPPPSMGFVDPVAGLAHDVKQCRRTLDAFVTHRFAEAGRVGGELIGEDDIVGQPSTREVRFSIGHAPLDRIREDARQRFSAALAAVATVLDRRVTAIGARADALLRERGLDVHAVTPPVFHTTPIDRDLARAAADIQPGERRAQHRSFKSQLTFTNPLMILAPLITAGGFILSILYDKQSQQLLQRSFAGMIGVVTALLLVISLLRAIPRLRAERAADLAEATAGLAESGAQAVAAAGREAATLTARAVSAHLDRVDDWIAATRASLAPSASPAASPMAALSRESGLRTELGGIAARIAAVTAIAEQARGVR
ncbi:hypothetical protein ASE70_01950 [Sphingomonas sp. Leaf22]|uniref:hypothetical protein n=1 Tax=Sphingomonas sp. Leaf22 TaxID=1735687 RepID=UPI000701AAFD|nr:hypothetical protein [Sphingomonas sp. Leaf22]KQM90205.1 hypothetical protein ASE70_01950 [Sphingomonas sp. Leaf22]